MNFAAADPIVKAVLYEGYILYPYHSSALKNQQRWTFGGIYPQAYSAAQGGSEPYSMQTECLVDAGPECRLDIAVRFLHLQNRQVGKVDRQAAGTKDGLEPPYQAVESLTVGGRRFTSWQEAVEREVACPSLSCKGLADQPARLNFSFPASREVERLYDSTAVVEGSDFPLSGLLVRTQQALQGRVEISIELLRGDPREPTDRMLYKVRVQIANLTPLTFTTDGIDNLTSRDSALVCSLISTHTLLGVSGGEFISLMDPPDSLRELAAGCQNIGAWPVLVGEPGQRDLMLSSPITLYDYPQVAPESPGNLFDGTEIDELLTLNILTLTEEEKQGIRATDERGREMLERTEALNPEMLARLHGAIRGMRHARRME